MYQDCDTVGGLIAALQKLNEDDYVKVKVPTRFGDGFEWVSISSVESNYCNEVHLEPYG